jgi:hypothetical protein
MFILGGVGTMIVKVGKDLQSVKFKVFEASGSPAAFSVLVKSH